MPDPAPAAPPPAAATVTVYDRQGQPVELPHDQATAGLISGQYGLPSGQRQQVVKDGQLGTVPSEKLPDFLKSGGQLAAPDVVAAHEREKKYGTFGQQAITAAENFADQASLGASTALEAGILGNRADIQARREANPLTAGGAGLAGALAPAFIGDEAGLLGGAKLIGEGAEGLSVAARAGEAGKAGLGLITAPSRALFKAGDAIEGAAGKLLGLTEDAPLVTQLAKKAAAKGASFAVQGAVAGIANEVDEDTIGDHELNAEKLYASGVHGALLGLGAGVGLTAAGEIGSRVLGRLRPGLAGQAEEQAFRALNPMKAFVKEAERIPGGASGIGRTLLDKGLMNAGETVEQVAPRIAEAEDEAGAKVGAIYDSLDQAGVERVRARDITERIEQDTLRDLEKLPELNQGAIGRVKMAVREAERAAGIPSVEEAAAGGIDRELVREQATVGFKQLQEFRSTIGKTINWKFSPLVPPDAANEAMKDVYGAITKEMEAAAEKGAKQMGGDVLKELRAANLEFRQLRVASKTAENAVTAGMANRVVSPSDYITGAAAMAHHGGKLLGGAVAGATAEEAGTGGQGGIGGALAGAATGAAAALLHHQIRVRGNTTAAVILDKLSALHGVERAAAAVDREVSRGVAGILRDEPRAEVGVREFGHPYRDHAEAVSRVASQPEAHAQTLEDAAAPLAPHAPKTAAAFQAAGLRAVQYLLSIAPHVQQPPTLTPHLDQPRVSKADEAKYLLAAHAVHDPMSVLSDMSKGQATRAQVDAIKAVYPKLYDQIAQQLQERLAERSKPVPYEQRKQLALLFGAAAGAEFDPAFGAQMQSTFGNAPGPNGPPSGAGKRGGGAPKRKLQGADERLKLPGS